VSANQRLHNTEAAKMAFYLFPLLDVWCYMTSECPILLNPKVSYILIYLHLLS